MEYYIMKIGNYKKNMAISHFHPVYYEISLAGTKLIKHPKSDTYKKVIQVFQFFYLFKIYHLTHITPKMSGWKKKPRLYSEQVRFSNRTGTWIRHMMKWFMKSHDMDIELGCILVNENVNFRKGHGHRYQMTYKISTRQRL